MLQLSVGDTIAMQGEVTIVHDDGQVTVRLRGFSYPITTRGEHLSLVWNDAWAKVSARANHLR